MSPTTTPHAQHLQGLLPTAIKKVDFAGQDIQTISKDEIEPGRGRWISASGRNQTNLNDVVVETRAVRRTNVFRRPRALLYHSIDGPNEEGSASVSRTSSNTSNQDAKDAEERSTDNITKQLSRLDLFVDLVWVGIIANLSGTFGEQAFTDSGVDTGLAVLEFILLFLPIWRVWDWLRNYTSHYYLDDVVQRLFLVWILILAVLYGVNAPFAFIPNGEKTSLTLLISIYLIARGSFLAAISFQTIFLPVLRRQLLFEFCAGLIPFGLYLGSIWTPYPGKLVMLILANAIEHPATIFQASPAGERLLLPKGTKKVMNIDRYIERYEGFFIIILGEGVFRLIEGSPSGLGINSKTGTVLTSLLLYYVLHWLYFNGDQSKHFVHALRRTWWKPILWQLYHVAMFAALLFLDASSLYLVEHRDSSPLKSKREAETGAEPAEDSEKVEHYVLYALWSASISLAVALVCMTNLALLNRSLDPPKTLLINSRYLRLAPRLPATIVILCLPLFRGMNGSSWCGAAIIILYLLFLFESNAGLERNWKFIEPKDEGGTSSTTREGVL